jgi:hypothetical protein
MIRVVKGPRRCIWGFSAGLQGAGNADFSHVLCGCLLSCYSYIMTRASFSYRPWFYGYFTPLAEYGSRSN